MTTTTTLTTWWLATHSVNPATVVETYTGDFYADYDLDAATADYVDAIRDALPESLTLAGTEVYGPYDYDGDAAQELRDASASVDLAAIVQRHDISAQVESLTVIHPSGHDGSKRDVLRIVSAHTGVPQSRIRVARMEESQIDQYATVHYLRPWSRGYVPAEGWAPYLVVTGREVYEGALDCDEVDQS